MIYEIEIDGVGGRLELRRTGFQCVFRWNGGNDQVAHCTTPEPGVYSILVGGRSYEARVENGDRETVVTLNGRRFVLRISDPRRWRRSGSSVLAGSRTAIVAPMPGKVVRVLAAPGDRVEAGQGIVVVEAMKMQNEMKAARAGIVVAISATAGAAVTAGETLAIIE